MEGVLVGHSTIIRGEGPLRPGHGPVRTGVTAATSWTAHIDGELDRLADAVEAGLDMAAVDRLLFGA